MPQRRRATPIGTVGVVMGSDSDWEIMQHAVLQLTAFGVPHEAKVLSAHRTPEWMFEYARNAAGRGLRVIIAGAGGAAHLPGMVASLTSLPVLGVPVPSTQLAGIDALLSIAQMPRGVPVGTLAVAFLLIMAAAVAEAIQVVGVLLILTLLITPGATAERLSPRPGVAMLWSIAIALSGSTGRAPPGRGEADAGDDQERDDHDREGDAVQVVHRRASSRSRSRSRASAADSVRSSR